MSINDLTWRYVNGTGTTVSELLTSLKSTFDSITAKQKRDCYLNISGNILQHNNDYSFYSVGMNPSSGTIKTFAGNIDTGFYRSADISSAGAVTYTNNDSLTGFYAILYYKG